MGRPSKDGKHLTNTKQKTFDSMQKSNGNPHYGSESANIPSMASLSESKHPQSLIRTKYLGEVLSLQTPQSKCNSG